MIKGLIAIDLDGSALNNRQALSQRTKQVLKKACDYGYQVVIATGRPPRSSIHYHRELGLTSPMITFNGAFVYGEGDSQFHYHIPLDRRIALDILQECYHLPVENVMLEIKDEFYIWKEDEISQFLMYGGMPAAIGPIEQYVVKHPTEILIRTTKEYADTMMSAIKQRFAGHVELRYWGDYFNIIEIKRAGISKVSGLSYIAEKMGITSKQVIAFGDGSNDLEMLKWAGMGIAMGNAGEEVKQQADFVTDSNDKDGIANFLVRTILREK